MHVLVEPNTVQDGLCNMAANQNLFSVRVTPECTTDSNLPLLDPKVYHLLYVSSQTQSRRPKFSVKRVAKILPTITAKTIPVLNEYTTDSHHLGRFSSCLFGTLKSLTSSVCQSRQDDTRRILAERSLVSPLSPSGGLAVQLGVDPTRRTRPGQCTHRRPAISQSISHVRSRNNDKPRAGLTECKSEMRPPFVIPGFSFRGECH
ncbi:hypothetical protein J6590_004258 [Homalodisca vitripennis]|nr:hypothetical protein J6590_004258 [Homalodisca vitripennis]